MRRLRRRRCFARSRTVISKSSPAWSIPGSTFLRTTSWARRPFTSPPRKASSRWRSCSSPRARTPNGESVLHAAAMIESTSLMTALIEAGADKNLANNDGETPLQWAAMTGTFLAVKALADAGADLDVQDVPLANTALHAAVSHDDIALIHYLISKNVRTDLRNNAGLTAFELAQSRGRGSAKLFER